MLKFQRWSMRGLVSSSAILHFSIMNRWRGPKSIWNNTLPDPPCLPLHLQQIPFRPSLPRRPSPLLATRSSWPTLCTSSSRSSSSSSNSLTTLLRARMPTMPYLNNSRGELHRRLPATAAARKSPSPLTTEHWKHQYNTLIHRMNYQRNNKIVNS